MFTVILMCLYCIKLLACLSLSVHCPVAFQFSSVTKPKAEIWSWVSQIVHYNRQEWPLQCDQNLTSVHAYSSVSADDMGLGKTLTMISLVMLRRQRKHGNKEGDGATASETEEWKSREKQIKKRKCD